MSIEYEEFNVSRFELDKVAESVLQDHRYISLITTQKAIGNLCLAPASAAPRCQHTD